MIVFGVLALIVLFVLFLLWLYSGFLSKLDVAWMRYMSLLGRVSSLLLLAGMAVFIVKYSQAWRKGE